MEQMLQTLQKAFPLHEKALGADAVQHVKPMTFQLRQFEVEEIGNLSLMRGKALFGLMRMETLILTPLLRDAPLFSYDRIFAMGNDTLLTEWYDTAVLPPDAALQKRLDALQEPQRLLAAVPAYELGAHWYDSMKLPASAAHRGRGCAEAYAAYRDAALRAYLALLGDAPAVDRSAKKSRVTAYVDGLFTHGGPSTDAFIKALGREKARALFDSVIFGIA